MNNVKCKPCPEDSSDSDDIGLFVVDCATSVNVTASPESQKTGKWIIDSGATCHICNNQSSFVELYPLKTSVNVKLGDGHTMDASAIGVVSLRAKFGQVIRRYKLHDVLYVPNFLQYFECLKGSREGNICEVQ